MIKNLISISLLLAIWCQTGQAQNIILERQEESGSDKSKSFFLPFLFFNESLGFAGGISYTARELFQKQTIGQINVIGGLNGALLVNSTLEELQLPGFKRIFLTTIMRAGKFGQIKQFTGVNPDFPNETAGNNDSSRDNFFDTEGTDIDLQYDFHYLLPIGHGRDRAVAEIVLDNGILFSGQTGATSWNPLRSGRTYLQLFPFYRRQGLTFKDDTKTTSTTSGLSMGLIYDNTDFSENPSRGSFHKISFIKDWGKLGSSAPWEVLEYTYSKYISLGKGARTRQRTLAFNFWTVNSLTWNDFDLDENGNKIFRRPRSFTGATLGGLFRFRGFDPSRFSDRAAILYTVEYRLTPTWNPLPRIGLLGSDIVIDWIQWVGFIEVGRVAPEWKLGTLHESMKWNAGLSMRFWANTVLLRLDLGVSSEGSQVQMTVSHPF